MVTELCRVAAIRPLAIAVTAHHISHTHTHSTKLMGSKKRRKKKLILHLDFFLPVQFHVNERVVLPSQVQLTDVNIVQLRLHLLIDVHSRGSAPMFI